MKDELGERMKGQYEDRTRYFVPRRTYSIIRLDGKAFHTYTRNLSKPFDDDLSEDLDKSIIAMLSEIQGAVFAYTESDEISVLVTDFALPTTSAWFDGNVQKIVSVSSSIMTANFNQRRLDRQVRVALENDIDFAESDTWPLAFFDARLFTIPDRIEVMNYFIWRNQDCSRNSVSMVAQYNFSHRELQGQSTNEMKEMLQSVDPWENYSESNRYGRLIVKETYLASVPVLSVGPSNIDVERTHWVSKPAWRFTEDKEKLLTMIPKYE